MDKQCPYCAETIKAAAIKCRYCQSDLSVQAKLPRDVGPQVASQPIAVSNDRQMDEAGLRYQAERKSAGVAYFLWLIFGTFGGHRYYFGYVESAVAMSGIAVLSLLFMYAGAENNSLLFFGMLGYAAVGIWALVDAFQIPGWAKTLNSALVSDLKLNPGREPQTNEAPAQSAPAVTPSQAISISICPKCRAQGSGDDIQCGRCGHAFA